jgi:hypothetical protein
LSLIFLVFSVVLLCVLTFLVPCCDAHYDFHIKTMFCSSLLTVVCRRAHVLFTLAVLVCALWYLTHIVLCFLFFFCLSLSCVWRCLVYPMLPVCLSVSCVWRCLVYPMLPVCLSLSCVLCMEVSCIPYVASFTVLTIPDCPFGFSNVYCYVIHNCCFVDRCLSFLYFFFWPFCCLFFFDMQIMITP